MLLFPLNIAKLVKMVFPVPAASSKSERVFFVRQCGHLQEGQVESCGGGGPRGGEVQLKVSKYHGLQRINCDFLLIDLISST